VTTDPAPAPVRIDRQLVRLLAVEVLLTHPEELGNDALETDLYILRDQLRAAVQSSAMPSAPKGAGRSAG
jgi:hypothetical protein